jgi:VanZ family protein
MRVLQRVLRVVAVLAAIGLPLGLYYGGAQPYAVGLIPEPWDKLAHAGVFAVLAAAVGYASGWRGRPVWWLGFTVALAVGAFDEFHQMSLPGRAAGWDDLAADAFGAVMGATVLRWRRVVKRWVERTFLIARQ